MNLTILDYGMGNLRSVEKAFAHFGVEARITSDPAAAARATHLVVPGVGAFGQAVLRLREAGLDRAIRAAVDGGAHFLGICLGMQLLFETSEEHGRHHGLGLLKGEVKRLPPTVKVPEVGWNRISFRPGDPLLEGIEEGEFFYFDQSYYCAPADPDDLLSETDYGVCYASAVRKGRVRAVQFHPEKSQRAGLRLLENFARLT